MPIDHLARSIRQFVGTLVFFAAMMIGLAILVVLLFDAVKHNRLILAEVRKSHAVEIDLARRQHEECYSAWTRIEALADRAHKQTVINRAVLDRIEHGLGAR